MSKLAYQYVVLRCVPRVDREEFVNVGVVLYCQATDFLDVAWHVDRERLRALDPRLDLDQVCEALGFVEGVCAGDERGGAASQKPIGPALRLPQGAAEHRPPARPRARRRHHRPGPPARAPDGAAGRLGLDEPVLVGEHHDLHPVAQAELAQDRADVGLHRRLAGEDQRRRSRCSTARARPRRRPRAPSRSARGTPPAPASGCGTGRPAASTGRSGASTALPACTVRIASRSITGVVSLSRNPLAPYRIAVAARSSRLNVVSTTTRTGVSRAGGPVGREDLPGRLDAVHLRHPDVHEHHVGLELVDQPHRLQPVGGRADDLHALLGVDDHPRRPRGTAPGRRPAAPGSSFGSITRPAAAPRRSR